jgi:Queuosine salvage protein
LSTPTFEFDPIRDPLGVLATTRRVIERARDVRIDLDQVEAVADELLGVVAEQPSWDDALHFRDGTWRTAGWIFVLDALNFCFWSEDPDPEERWRVEYEGELYDGYWALAAALRRAVDEGKPIWDPRFLIELPARDVAHILRAHDLAAPEIPLFSLRVANLHELGRGLLDCYEGPEAAAVLIGGAKRSAVRLIEEVISRFPSFNDVAVYEGEEVRFYKRAQILVADLAGAFDHEGLGAFDDLDCLTAFADYKVPQVLRRLGVLVYSDDLAGKIDRWELIPAGSPAEIEIRAATIWGCEFLRLALARRGRELRAFEIDWALWTAGQFLPLDATPYHRTYTGFY